jgi:hypothetical protein
MDGLMITLRLVHILLGVIWAGWGIALALFINPAIGIAGPAGGQFMQALAGKTNLVKVMTIAPILVIITGIWMLWVVSGGFNTSWMMSTHGMTLLIGSTLGIVAAIYGLGFVRPLAMQMGQLGAKIAASGAPPTSETACRRQGGCRALGCNGPTHGRCSLRLLATDHVDAPAMRFRALPALNHAICWAFMVWRNSITSDEPSACLSVHCTFAPGVMVSMSIEMRSSSCTLS